MADLQSRVAELIRAQNSGLKGSAMLMSGVVEVDGGKRKVVFPVGLAERLPGLFERPECVRDFPFRAVLPVVVYALAGLPAVRLGEDWEMPVVDRVEVVGAACQLGSPNALMAELLASVLSGISVETVGQVLRAIERAEDRGMRPLEENGPSDNPLGSPWSWMYQSAIEAALYFCVTAPKEVKAKLNADLTDLKCYGGIIVELMDHSTKRTFPCIPVAPRASSDSNFLSSWNKLRGGGKTSFSLEVKGGPVLSADRFALCAVGGLFGKLAGADGSFREGANGRAALAFEKMPYAAFELIYSAIFDPWQAATKLQGDASIENAIALLTQAQYLGISSELSEGDLAKRWFAPLLTAAQKVVDQSLTPKTSFSFWYGAKHFGGADNSDVAELAVKTMKQSVAGAGVGADGLIDTIVRQENEICQLRAELAELRALLPRAEKGATQVKTS